MTKPVGYFVSGEAIDLLIAMYGAYLQKLNREQLIHLLFLAAEQLFDSYTGLDGEEDDAAPAWALVEKACGESDDVALGLLEAIVSQLRYPLGTAPNEKAIES